LIFSLLLEKEHARAVDLANALCEEKPMP
jgi:hypothetical protein